MPPIIDEKKCVKCGLCAQICPMDVIKVEKCAEQKEVVVKYPNECWHCRACAIDCPQKAIKMRYPLSHMMFHMEAPNAKRSER